MKKLKFAVPKMSLWKNKFCDRNKKHFQLINFIASADSVKAVININL